MKKESVKLRRSSKWSGTTLIKVLRTPIPGNGGSSPSCRYVTVAQQF